MKTLALILLATLFVSLLSLVGIVLLIFKKRLEDILIVFVSFAAGSLIGAAFFHLLPESFGVNFAFFYVVAGIILFFIIEKFLYWRHCHVKKCVHTFTYMSLIGDAVHNFIDGAAIAISFVSNTGLGIATTLAVAFHEIPQEIGDFSILLYGGFSKKKALLFNFITALTAVFGGILTYALSFTFNFSFLLPLAAGGFIYIAMADLMPELHKEKELKKSIAQIVSILAGIAIMFALKFV